MPGRDDRTSTGWTAPAQSLPGWRRSPAGCSCRSMPMPRTGLGRCWRRLRCMPWGPEIVGGAAARPPCCTPAAGPSAPVCPENSKTSPFLTFSTDVLILDPCTFASATVHGDEVFHDATRGLCLAGLRRRAVPIAHFAAPRASRTAASAGRVSANCPPPTAPLHGSPVLGLALASLACLGRRPGVRPTPYGHHVAAAAVP